MSLFKTIWGILTLKCPKCRSAAMFSNPNLLNIKDIDKMPDNCPECGQDFVIEPGFYYGSMFVSYALSALAFFIVLGISLLLYGSISRTYMYTTVIISLFFWTYVFRISRVIWLNISIVLFPPNHSD